MVNIEFRVNKLKDNSRLWRSLSDKTNTFFIVGEEIIGEREYYRVIQEEEKGVSFLGDFKIDQLAYSALKEDLIPTDEYCTYDIPKRRLSLDIVENIQRLNFEH